jgi:glycerol-3-phosphate dehydrogenase
MIRAHVGPTPFEGIGVSQAATIILGGGIAGLWLCDALRRRGDAVVLLESRALGTGQTIGSQGIIHGGTKYALAGRSTESSAAIRDMPGRWRAFLSGSADPDLRRVAVRAQSCHLWQTRSMRSQLGMIGARVGLRVAPDVLDRAERPPALRECPGVVARLDEQVVDVVSLVTELARRNADCLLSIPEGSHPAFERDASGKVLAVELASGTSGGSLRIAAGAVVLAAGSGNAALRQQLGLPEGAMQRRPLHMVMVRGSLPVLHGHCVDGAATRATITTVTDRAGRTVWQVGGQVAESGVGLEPAALVAHTLQELEAILPGLSLDHAEWATYRVDRAERAMGGRRPADAQSLVEGNVITVWPTKLALAPRLADRILELVPPRPGALLPLPPDWPRPLVAAPPWELEDTWIVAR